MHYKLGNQETPMHQAELSLQKRLAEIKLSKNININVCDLKKKYRMAKIKKIMVNEYFQSS